MAHQIILVDKLDRQVGLAGKTDVHRNGLLHRAFSVVIFNDADGILIQQRAIEKYHSGGLWSNACCGHPWPGVSEKRCAEIRLEEEMGFSATLEYQFKFMYHIALAKDLTENEIDYVYTGKYNGRVNPVASEVLNYQWIRPEKLKQWIRKSPGEFTYWALQLFEKYLSNDFFVSSRHIQ